MNEAPLPALTDKHSESPSADSSTLQAHGRRFCGACGHPLTEGGGECLFCVQRQHTAATTQTHSVDVGEIKSALFLYFSLLAVSIVSVTVALVSDDGLSMHGEIVAQIAMSVIVVIWSVVKFTTIRPVLLSRAAPRWYLAACGLAIGTFLVATVCVHLLHKLAEIPTIDYLVGVEPGVTGFLWAVIWICVQPAVFEELAFRGVIQGSLARVVGPWQAVLASAIMFTVLHLSAPSAPHLLILGIVLAWLRMRSGSIYPGMLLHFAHNFLVIVSERTAGYSL